MRSTGRGKKSPSKTLPGIPDARVGNSGELRETLSEIASSIPIVLYSFRLGADGVMSFLYASPALQSIFGIGAEEVMKDATRAFATMHPDDVSRVRETILESARTMQSWHEEFRARHPLKGELWFEGLTYPRREPDGGVIWHGYIADITARKEAQKALQESEERFHKLFRSSPVTLTVSEIDTGVFIDVNERAEEFFGRGRAHMIGKSSLDIGVWRDPTARVRVISDLLASGAVKDAPVQLVTGSGEVRDVLLSMVKLAHGGRLVILSCVLDVTESARAERSLRESELRFATIFHLSPMPHLLSEVDTGVVVDVNQTFLTMFGYAREEVVGVSTRTLGLMQDWDVREEIVARLRAEGAVRDTVVRMVTKPGSVRDVLWSGSIVDLEGRKLLLSIYHDITERKQLEEKLLHAQKMEAVGRLAGGIAHDFNNMTGVILGFASLLEEKIGPSSPLVGDVQQILSAAQRSANLTRQLLAFARKQVAAPVPLDLNKSLRSMEKVATRILGEDISLKLSTQDGLWTVKIDPSQMDQILANLATNARDAIENVGTVIIETSNVVVDPACASANEGATPGEYVMLSFSDTGTGMDEATKARLFEPFFTTKPKDRGTGLGLATIFGIMRQNNGFVSVFSELGNGTTFKLFFPRHHGETETGGDAKEPTRTTGDETILVVEDEEQILALSKMTLEQNGYTVIGFTSPMRAVSFCEKSGRRMDLLLSDMVMPDMNGKDLSERLHSLRPGLKTLYMSGYPADVIAERGILEQGTHFIQKPFTPGNLLVMVRKVLDGK
jgi:two-component system, cell cycle sensor histidine kinase and response regulator CckA